MSNKSDSDLMFYINNKSQFQFEAVIAAIDELEKRGKTNSKLKNIRNVLSEKLVNERKKETKSKLDLNFKIPKDSPKTISIAIKLIYTAIGVVLLGLFILGITTDFFVDNAYEKRYFSIALIVINLAVIEGIIKRKRSIILLLIFSILLGLLLFLLTLSYARLYVTGPLLFITFGLQVYTLTLLYKTDSNKWFKKKQNKK